MAQQDGAQDKVLKFFEDVMSGFLGLRNPTKGPVLLEQQDSRGSIDSCESFQPRDESSGAQALRDGPLESGPKKVASFSYALSSPTSGCVVSCKKSPRRKSKRCLERDFDVEEEALGRGHFGVVRVCTERTTGDRYACKSMDKSKLKYWDDVEDIRREIAVMKQLNDSPYVVNFHRAYEDEQFVHVVMELCEGGDLFDDLSKRGHLPEMEACTLFAEIVKAVSHCHAHGILHRDIKPENVLLCHPCSPTSPLTHRKRHMRDASPIKLADFGLSMFIEGSNQVYGVAGSPFYLAPEVLTGGYSLPADVWSLGVVLFMMLSGTAPFGGSTEEEVLACVRRGKFAFKSSVWADVSTQAKDLIRRMLHMSPMERPAAEGILEHSWFREMGVPTRIISRSSSTSASESEEEISINEPASPVKSHGSCSSASSFCKGRASPPLHSPVSHLGFNTDFSPFMSRATSTATDRSTPAHKQAAGSPISCALLADSTEVSPAGTRREERKGESGPKGKPFLLPTSAVGDGGDDEAPGITITAADTYTNAVTDADLAQHLPFVDWVFGF